VTAPSRITTRCCGADCFMEDYQTPEQPCWGKVEQVGDVPDGEYEGWSHACQGHWDLFDGLGIGEYDDETQTR
jgi:hypothetical protein